MLIRTVGRSAIVILSAVFVLVAALLLASCSEPAQDRTGSDDGVGVEATPTSLVGSDASVIGSGLPTLVDLGSDTCVPCKMMEPILEELATQLDGRLHVVFINTREDRDAVERFAISLIPTQVFFGGEGEELFRHQGFLSREDILAKWTELGYEFGDASGDETGDSAVEA